MSVMGSLGGWGRPGIVEDRSSDVISAISTKSRLSIRLTIFDGNAASGLNGPGAFRDVGRMEGAGLGGSFRLDAASASRVSPSGPLGVNSGRLASLIGSPTAVGSVCIVEYSEGSGSEWGWAAALGRHLYSLAG